VGKTVTVFGAGITGLAAARELARRGYRVDVYEASDHVGGLASTFRDEEGFIYDNGPRFIFSTLAEKIGISEICKPVRYYEHLLVKGRYYLYPFGFVQNPFYCVSAGLAMCTRILHRRPANLGEYLRVYYGRLFSREVLVPLIEKWSGLPAEEMSVDFAARLLPTNLGYFVHQVLRKIRGGRTEDYWRKGRYIVYPEGTNLKIFEALSKAPGISVHLRSPLTRIRAEGGRIKRAEFGTAEVSSDYYLSTIPISRMADLVSPPETLAEWTRFRYRGVLILFAKINRPRVLDGLWTWFPEPKYRFYRIAEFKNALPEMAPPGKTLISIEMSADPGDPFWNASAEKIYETVSRDLGTLYGLRREEILGFDLKRSPEAYPVLRKSTEEAQRRLTHETPLSNLFLAGRTGMFQYRMMEGSYDSAMECVEALDAAAAGRSRQAASSHSVDRYGRPELVPE
jgi:oxygen-dependent protoporphyrinogen oxidase